MDKSKIKFFAFLSLLMVVCIVFNIVNIITGTANDITVIALVGCVFALVCDLAVIWGENKR